MSPLLDATLGFSAVVISASIFLCLVRLRMGPTIMDRILAFDTICVLLVALMVVLSIYWVTPLYLDLILVFTLLSFFSTVAFSLYLYRTYDVLQDHPELPKRGQRSEP